MVVRIDDDSMMVVNLDDNGVVWQRENNMLLSFGVSYFLEKKKDMWSCLNHQIDTTVQNNKMAGCLSCLKTRLSESFVRLPLELCFHTFFQ